VLCGAVLWLLQEGHFAPTALERTVRTAWAEPLRTTRSTWQPGIEYNEVIFEGNRLTDSLLPWPAPQAGSTQSAGEPPNRGKPNLLLLAPDIQEEVLFLEAVDGQEPLSERGLRAIAHAGAWEVQRERWREVRTSF
jgi:hypothetical protein